MRVAARAIESERRAPRREYFTGLDVGQVRDPSALAVVEWAGEWDGAAFRYEKRTALRLRYLERTPLGTPYPELVERAARVACSGAMDGRRHLVVDATGVGRPVVDLLKKQGMPWRLWPVVITSGYSGGWSDGCHTVPKRDLIVGLQVLLQRGRLHVAAGMKEWPALIRELGQMRVKVTGGGKEQFEAWREGEHDDLVLALALACWAAGRVHPEGEGRSGLSSGVC